jgi:hypothetical protein
VTLRESFAGINARFHLVGCYTLLELLLRFVAHWTLDDPDGPPIVLAAYPIFFTAICGILGLVYEAAAGRPGSHSAVGWALGLFLPMAWLWIKIYLVLYGVTALSAAGFRLAGGGGVPFEKAFEQVLYWAAPFLGFGVQVLALYAAPLCVLSRTRGEWRPNIRDGLRLLRACPVDSRRLMLVLLMMLVLTGGLHYVLGPDGSKAAPGIPEALVLFANSYLALVVFFGGTRVVLSRQAAGRSEAPLDAGTAAPGPLA